MLELLLELLLEELLKLLLELLLELLHLHLVLLSHHLPLQVHLAVNVLELTMVRREPLRLQHPGVRGGEGGEGSEGINKRTGFACICAK